MSCAFLPRAVSISFLVWMSLMFALYFLDIFLRNSRSEFD